MCVYLRPLDAIHHLSALRGSHQKLDNGIQSQGLLNDALDELQLAKLRGRGKFVVLQCSLLHCDVSELTDTMQQTTT